MSKSFTISLDMLMLKLAIKMRLKNTFATSSGEYCESGHPGMQCSGERGGVAGALLPFSHSLSGVAWSEEATRL